MNMLYWTPVQIIVWVMYRDAKILDEIAKQAHPKGPSIELCAVTESYLVVNSVAGQPKPGLQNRYD